MTYLFLSGGGSRSQAGAVTGPGRSEPGALAVTLVAPCPGG